MFARFISFSTRILELGSGTGVLAVQLILTIIHGLPHLRTHESSAAPISFHLTCTDCDERALELARRNVMVNLGARVKLLDGDPGSSTEGPLPLLPLATRRKRAHNRESLQHPSNSPLVVVSVSFALVDWSHPTTYSTAFPSSRPSGTPPSPPPYNLVIATDCIYNELVAS